MSNIANNKELMLLKMNYKVVSYIKDIVKKPWCNSTNLTQAVVSNSNWTEWSTI